MRADDCLFAFRLGRKNDGQKHFEFFHSINGVGMTRGHQDRLAGAQGVLFPVDRDFSNTVKRYHERVSVGFVRADFFSLGKRKQCKAYRVVLCKRFARHLAGRVIYKAGKGQNGRGLNIFNQLIHNF